MNESNLTDLPEDDDEDTIGVPAVHGRERSAERPEHLAFRGDHADVTVPICSQCRMNHGSIKTGTGMLCAACWMRRMNEFRADPKRKRRR